MINPYIRTALIAASFLPPRMRSRENYKESRPNKKKKCSHSLLCNGYTDLRSLPILPPFSKTGHWCQVEGKVTS